MLLMRLFARAFAPAVEALWDCPWHLYSGGGNKHSFRTVAQDKRAATKRRNKLRAKQGI